MNKLNQCLVLQTPGAMVGGTGKKLNNFVGIEFTRGASDNGGVNGYHKMLGDEELLSSLDLFNKSIKLALINNGDTKAILNQLNINKTESGATADLAGTDGSDVMQRVDGMWAIVGGTDPTYERYLYSDTYFEYGNDKAVWYDAHAEAPDKLVVVNGVSRSIFSNNPGTMGVTKATGISDGSFANANGYPSTYINRDGFENYARAKNENKSSNFPYCNGTVHDLEFMLGILFIEMRTKDFTKVFGHGISSNVVPSDDNWNDTTGFRTTVGNVKKYLTFDTTIWIGGASMNIWFALNGSHSLLKVLQAQKEISDGGVLESVKNTDGIALPGVSKGVMTGIYKKTITFTLNCAFTASEDDAAHTFELHLCIPVWRGATWMQGNIWQNLSGYDVINYRGAGETADHNLLYRAKSIADIITDGENAEHADINQKFGVESAYELVCDLGSVAGWTTDAITKNGVSLAITKGAGAAINNYQSAWLSLPSANTTNVRRRYNAGLFGGYAHNMRDVLRLCFAGFDASHSGAYFGGRFRCRLNS